MRQGQPRLSVPDAGKPSIAAADRATIVELFFGCFAWSHPKPRVAYKARNPEDNDTVARLFGYLLLAVRTSADPARAALAAEKLLRWMILELRRAAGVAPALPWREAMQLHARADAATDLREAEAGLDPSLVDLERMEREDLDLIAACETRIVANRARQAELRRPFRRAS